MKKVKKSVVMLLVISFAFFSLNSFNVKAENANDQSDSDDNPANIIVNGNEVTYLDNDTEDPFFEKIIDGSYAE